MIETLLTAVYWSAAVGVISCLISESTLFSPIRERFKNYHLIFCPICMGFWIALPAMMVGGPLMYFAVVGFSNAWMLLILHTYEALDRKFEETDEDS
jgi:hypothetical protein